MMPYGPKRLNSIRAKRHTLIYDEARAAAKAEREARAKLSPEEKLMRLDWRLGVGVGAKRERARLQKLLQK